MPSIVTAGFVLSLARLGVGMHRGRRRVGLFACILCVRLAAGVSTHVAPPHVWAVVGEDGAASAGRISFVFLFKRGKKNTKAE